MTMPTVPSKRGGGMRVVEVVQNPSEAEPAPARVEDIPRPPVPTPPPPPPMPQATGDPFKDMMAMEMWERQEERREKRENERRLRNLQGQGQSIGGANSIEGIANAIEKGENAYEKLGKYFAPSENPVMQFMETKGAEALLGPLGEALKGFAQVPAIAAAEKAKAKVWNEAHKATSERWREDLKLYEQAVGRSGPNGPPTPPAPEPPMPPGVEMPQRGPPPVWSGPVGVPGASPTGYAQAGPAPRAPGWPPAQAPGWPPQNNPAPGWPPAQSNQAPGWSPQQGAPIPAGPGADPQAVQRISELEQRLAKQEDELAIYRGAPKAGGPAVVEDDDEPTSEEASEEAPEPDTPGGVDPSLMGTGPAAVEENPKKKAPKKGKW